ncbi:metal-dependent hydrolase [uncultured Roseibium sp.]|uniref:metal-dependent hydrolase n=1 Tax=uncultured Roseibium sp. TaxID=1936171 RepID=UPI003217F46E
MLTAHLPAGYCLTKLMKNRPPLLLPVALFFSILPDFDLIWFFWVDGRQIHHHRYWVHIPAFWAVVGTVSLVAFWRTRFRPYVVIAVAAVFLHLVLDSLVGGILWLSPWDNTLYQLITIQPTKPHWLFSFILHWTFLAEVVIWGLAVALYRGEGRATEFSAQSEAVAVAAVQTTKSPPCE